MLISKSDSNGKLSVLMDSINHYRHDRFTDPYKSNKSAVRLL